MESALLIMSADVIPFVNDLGKDYSLPDRPHEKRRAGSMSNVALSRGDVTRKVGRWRWSADDRKLYFYLRALGTNYSQRWRECSVGHGCFLLQFFRFFRYVSKVCSYVLHLFSQEKVFLCLNNAKYSLFYFLLAGKCGELQSVDNTVALGLELPRNYSANFALPSRRFKVSLCQCALVMIKSPTSCFVAVLVYQYISYY